MKRPARINVVLVIIVFALGAVAAWQIKREESAQEPPLAAIDARAVSHVRVRCVQCVERHFVRDATRWRMQEPYLLEADPSAVERLLAIASSPVRSRRPVDAFTLARIGLDPPAMTLQLDALEIDVGTVDALRGDRYVRIGNFVAMVPDRFSPFLMATPETELDRHLAPRTRDLVAVSVDGVAVSGALDAWRAAAARTLRARAPDQPISDSATRIELALGDGSRIAYRVERSVDGTLARRESPALDYLLDEAVIDSLIGTAVGR